MSASCRGAGSRSPRSRWRCSARRCGCIRDSRAGDRSETRLQKRLVEAELARLFERVGTQAHRAILADDLSVLVLVLIFELEEFLEIGRASGRERVCQYV